MQILIKVKVNIFNSISKTVFMDIFYFNNRCSDPVMDIFPYSQNVRSVIYSQLKIHKQELTNSY